MKHRSIKAESHSRRLQTVQSDRLEGFYHRAGGGGSLSLFSTVTSGFRQHIADPSPVAFCTLTIEPPLGLKEAVIRYG
jgi:hypothetical protein